MSSFTELQAEAGNSDHPAASVSVLGLFPAPDSELQGSPSLLRGRLEKHLGGPWRSASLLCSACCGSSFELLRANRPAFRLLGSTRVFPASDTEGRVAWPRGSVFSQPRPHSSLQSVACSVGGPECAVNSFSFSGASCGLSYAEEGQPATGLVSPSC